MWIGIEFPTRGPELGLKKVLNGLSKKRRDPAHIQITSLILVFLDEKDTKVVPMSKLSVHQEDDAAFSLTTLLTAKTKEPAGRIKYHNSWSTGGTDYSLVETSLSHVGETTVKTPHLIKNEIYDIKVTQHAAKWSNGSKYSKLKKQ